MFAGTSTGQVRSIKFPMSSEIEEFQDHQAHSAAVTKFKISYDDQYLFSVADDGCLFMYKIAEKGERVGKQIKTSVKKDKENEYSDEVRWEFSLIS